jgi:hypothetical protein
MNIRAKIFGGADAASESLLKAKQPKGVKADTLHSISVARETRQRSDSRGEDRHRLSGERVRITHNGTDYDVELINLSGGGAMIAAAFEPMLWDAIELHLGEHGTIECAVRWLRDDRIGVEFAHETRLDCPADEVATVLREVISRSFPDLELVDEEPVGDVPDECEGDENRTASRHPLIWNATLHHDYQSNTVRVRNISPTGAMIESEVPVRVGTQPLLEITETVSLSATVAWAVGDQVGLTFHTPFDMRTLAQAKPTVTAAEWLKPDYLGSADNDEDDSPWDPRWKRLTLVELQQELEGFLKH